MSELNECKTQIKVLHRSRATLKAKITKSFSRLNDLQSKDELTGTFFKKVEVDLSNFNMEVQKFEEKINDLLSTYEVYDNDVTFYNDELDNQTDYQFDFNAQADILSNMFSSEDNASNQSDTNVLIADALTKLAQANSETKAPNLRCFTFEGSEKDRSEFPNFLTQFDNAVGCKSISDASKMQLLISYLKGFALKLIQHLSIKNENYKKCLILLKKEFLDIPHIIEETYKKLLSSSISFDENFESTKIFIAEARSYLYELNNYELDFMEEKTPGYSLISHIIFNKLPNNIKKELIHKVGSNYVGVNDIFEYSSDIIKTILMTSRIKTQNKNIPFKPKLNNEKKFTGNTFHENKVGTLQNFKTLNEKSDSSTSSAFKKEQSNSQKVYHTSYSTNTPCKFENVIGHGMVSCKKYSDYDSRINRCKELNLCTSCSSSNHASGSSSCRGTNNSLDYKCKNCPPDVAGSHITALCPKNKITSPISNVMTSNLCFSSKISEQTFILPTLTINFSKGHKVRPVRCLLDFGSMRTYLGPNVLTDLCDSANISNLSEIDFDIKTFIGTEKRTFKQLSLGVQVSSSRYINAPLLIDANLDLEFEVTEMDSALKNLNNNNFSLADSSFNLKEDNSKIKLEGIIGIDILQSFPTISTIPCMKGTAFLIENRYVPYGNCENFLYNHQIENMYKRVDKNNSSAHTYDTISTLVNLVVDPVKIYFNPIEMVTPDSYFDQGLDDIFSLETMGISSKEENLTSYDQDFIDEFRNNIKFENNNYSVKLPWHTDRISKVSSNHKVALSVLDKVYANLDSNNLTNDYNAVFESQLRDGIIEQINVLPSFYDSYVWIPHRPVIKEESQVTTKIRPVFNASLKTNKDSYSLNEAAYSGIDLMSSLLKLLLKFRSNKYVMLSDIKSAFLMIKLSDDFDKNKFCFFLKKGDEILTYRYKTIIFGFISSPFMLMYVMKYHASKYDNDIITEILSSNFYMDNLIYTTNSLNELESIYREALKRMKDGGFILRSWCSNNEAMNDTLKIDLNFSEHGCIEEKVLGYKFNYSEDTMYIAKTEVNSCINTKRELLSESSKVYDPLNFALPILLKSKILLRGICSIRPTLTWDSPLPEDVKKVWSKLATDISYVHKIPFPRFALSTEKTYGLHVFCDSSSNCFGFIAYACDSNSSNFLFAKSKLAPLKDYSIPTLELLGVALAFKCIPTLLSAYSDIKFDFLNIVVDAQVVLSWLLSNDRSNIKSKFAKNRLKDIDVAQDDLKKRYGLDTYFKYICTTENSADLVTKPLSAKKFKQNLDFYLHGSKFITNNLSEWPKYDLLSISPEAKLIVNLNLIVQNEKFFDFSKYSSLIKVYRILTLVVKFCNNSRKIKADNPKIAKILALKLMQKEQFPDEIKFLKESPKNKIIPELVDNLNLCLDENDLLRSKGRISKCTYFNEAVAIPIILGKNSNLTKMIVLNAHKKVQHLGIQTTLNYVRNEGFWIPKGRQVVKKALADCYICKRYNSLAFSYPRYTNLPKHRMNLVVVWDQIGIDYFGPIYIRNPDNTLSKYYVLLLTDINVRCIHLELLCDLGTRSFLLAFIRFTELYRIPRIIYSDNAKTFISGGKILSNSLNSSEFKEHLQNNDIKHLFLPCFSAWFGAIYESLIRVIKLCAYKVIGRSKLTYFEMLTVLASIKNSVNSRPLTYRSFGRDDIEAISPNCFLKFNYSNSLVLRPPDGDVWKEEVDRDDLYQTLTVQEETIEKFRKLCHEEYVLSLRERSRKTFQIDWENRIKVGNVVLIRHPTKARPFWLLGKVLEVIIGDDNNIRSAKVLQSNGLTSIHLICHLHPMELSVTHTGTSQPEEDTSKTLEIENNLKTQSSKRPARKAAVKFRQFIQDNLDDL